MGFTSLAYLMDIDWLREAFHRPRKDGAPGVDGQTWTGHLMTMSYQEWHKDLHDGESGTNYCQAWSLVHFFIFHDHRRHEKDFLEFLLLLNRGVECKMAFVEAFGTPDFQAIEEKWKKYVRSTPTTDYRQTAMRLEFLAAGMKELYARDIRPVSIEELKSALREIHFEYTPTLFNQSQTLSARQNVVFEVPGQGGAVAPLFVLADTRGRPVDKRLPRSTSKPLNIMTQGLENEVFVAEIYLRGRLFEYRLSVTHTAPAVELPKNASHKRSL